MKKIDEIFTWEEICDIRVSILADIRVNQDNPYMTDEINRLKAIIRKLDELASELVKARKL